MKTIAVVEDNPDNALLVRVILGDRYHIIDYDNGQSALADLPSALPDLILLDISLPGIDGLEVLKRIKAIEQLKSIPVIALTAHAGLRDRERFIAAGFDDYVTKPIVNENSLLDAIEGQLHR